MLSFVKRESTKEKKKKIVKNKVFIELTIYVSSLVKV